MLNYRISARRTDSHGSIAMAKSAQVILDTDLAGRDDALNPVELLLSALAACIIKGIERVAPMIRFSFEGVEVEIDAERQDAPPKLVSISYRLLVRTSETDQRLELLHTNVRKYGTIYNTLASTIALSGTIGRLQ
ncbi:MAG: OsmC family peroxiredoxin [Hyphomicrobiales bacterium]|nr:MAG: OsmC family peroxiredoxin [Hyphomicrobiales bacterium]